MKNENQTEIEKLMSTMIEAQKRRAEARAEAEKEVSKLLEELKINRE